MTHFHSSLPHRQLRKALPVFLPVSVWFTAAQAA